MSAFPNKTCRIFSVKLKIGILYSVLTRGIIFPVVSNFPIVYILLWNTILWEIGTTFPNIFLSCLLVKNYFLVLLYIWFEHPMLSTALCPSFHHMLAFPRFAKILKILFLSDFKMPEMVVLSENCNLKIYHICNVMSRPLLQQTVWFSISLPVRFSKQ